MNIVKNNKILIFLGHPAHFHLFKNVIRKLKSESVDIDILIVTKDILEELVKHEGWSYKNIFPKGRRMKYLPIMLSMMWLQLLSEIRVFWHVIRNRPDLMIGTEGTLAHIGFILRIPSLLVNEDDTSVTPENYLFYPFATKVIVPDCVDVGLWEKRKIAYKGYHETFYLDRKYFTPREEVVREFNPSMGRYFIIRLVQLGASHDIGKKGIKTELAIELISILEKYGKVFITTEDKIDKRLEKYRLRIKPSDILDVLYYSDLYIGDSQTMAVEAALLGVPTIRFNSFADQCSILLELEKKYGLVINIKVGNDAKLFETVRTLIEKPENKDVWRKKSLDFFKDKTDNVDWFINTIKQFLPREEAADAQKRIIVDINHPAHVHFFKNFIWEAEKRGYKILITASHKDIAFELLDYYHFKYENLGSYGRSLIEKILNLFVIDYKMLKIVKGFKPDLIIGVASARAAHVSFILKRVKSYIFDDTEHATGQRALYKYFATEIFVPTCFTGVINDKYTTYKGYHELAYLHPNHFEHNVEYLQEAGLSENEKFFIVRFVAWEATHDIGKKGFSADGKIKLINELAKYGRVIITSERNVPENLKKYCLAVHPAKIHHIMAFSSLYIGEGATMASEAVILGVPSIYVNPLMMGYIREQQRFGLYFLPDETEAIEKAVEIAVNPEVFKKDMIEKQKNLFSEKIDVSSWIINRILD